MNEINDVWQRIIKYSTINNVKPKNKGFIFETNKLKIKFWIQKIDNYTILPYNEKGSKLYPIRRNDIEKDIQNNMGGNSDFTSKDFGTPAPSYRHALLNDNRIWLV